MPVRIDLEDLRVRALERQPVIQSIAELLPNAARSARSGDDGTWSFIPVYFSHGNRFHSPNQSEFCQRF